MVEFQRILGIDLGIASCGWGVIEVGEREGHIVAAGTRTFDAPLVDKTGEPKSAARRAARGQRRVIRRRRQRMNAIRALLHENGLLPERKSAALHDALHRAAKITPQTSPWTLRAAAFERALSDEEFAIVLGHIARHRGFRSNSKREAGNANPNDETSKMKKAMEQTRDMLAGRTFGQMIATDERFAERKRNRDKDFSHTAKRSDLEDEVRRIFQAQRRLGNVRASETLEQRFAPLAFDQRPLQDSESLVGKCPFEPEQKRAAKRAPSFELFRFLQRLVNLRLTVGRAGERPLTPEEIAIVLGKFGSQKSYTYKTLRKDLDLDPNARFAAVPRERESDDIAARKGQSAYGTCVLRHVLGDAPWHSLLKAPEKLDRIAEILSFREDLTSIEAGLGRLDLEPMFVECLCEGARKGAFTEFSGAAHVSALAARNIIPGLREGLVYSDACARVGYDHSARPAVALKDIGSPVTRRAFGEAIKQVRAVAREYGPFDAIHIELARDVGKSAEERREITDGIEKRNAEKDRRRKEAEDIVGRTISADELLRYELAKEQTWKCVYCDGAIAPTGFAGNDTRWQVDHILPWSRFGDDSYHNKTLCCSRCNQEKRGATPFEWFSASRTDTDWETFLARFESLKEMKGFKKRNLKLRNAAEVEQEFKERNLTDTKWVTKLIASELQRDPLKWLFTPSAGRQVRTRPGAITSKLRYGWGLESRKKENGERVADDRHHAVDALVLAATTESLLQRMTKEIQKREKEGRADDISHVEAPWPGFRLDVERHIYGHNGVGGVFVSRAERRRARGKAHDATIKQIRIVDGEEVVYERRPIEKLTEKDLERIPIPEPYGKVADPKRLRDELVETLRTWIAAKKPKDKLPRSPKGDIIRKVRVATKDKVAVKVNGGTVDRGDMARVDVFRKKNARGKWEFFPVPIYPHQIATQDAPPNRAVIAYKDDGDWTPIDDSFEFLWSLMPMVYLEIAKANGEVEEGYYRSLDRSTGAINLSPMETNDKLIRGIGTKTLSQFKKFAVDRLGRKFEVERELRTWRGKVCT